MRVVALALAAYGLVCMSAAGASTIGYWRFENGTLDARDPGTAGNVLDSSGMNNHGTAKSIGSVGGTSYYRAEVPTNLIPDTGEANSLSMEFANAGFPTNASHAQYVQVPHAESLQFGSTSSFTTEAWVKLSELANSTVTNSLTRQVVVYKKGASRTDGQMEYAFAAQLGDLKTSSFLASSGKPSGYTGKELALAFGSGTTNGNQYRMIISNLEITDLDWHFISVAFDATSGVARFVLDDQIETITGLGPEFAAYASNGNLHLGTNFNASNTFNGRFKGLMDEVRISNTALAVEELLNWQPDSLVPGDFDGDGDVDGADFVAWQTNYPTLVDATREQGDADADGDVDGADFAAWQDSFPNPSAGTVPVPEPAVGVLILAGLGTVGIGWLRRRYAI